jgi:hypothetical protein
MKKEQGREKKKEGRKEGRLPLIQKLKTKLGKINLKYGRIMRLALVEKLRKQGANDRLLKFHIALTSLNFCST